MKKTLFISSLLLGAGLLYAKNKVTTTIADYEAVFKQLKISLAGINKFDFSNGQLTADVSLNITNPTTTNLGVDTSNYVTLKKLLFYTQSGNYIGEAHPNISNIKIPALATTPTDPIPVVVPINNNVFSIGIELATSSNKLQVKAVIEAFNQTYTI